MKEIHQTLVSLGPLIAASVFSLSPKGKQEMVITDPPDNERRNSSTGPPPSDPTTGPDLLLKMQREDAQQLKKLQEAEASEMQDCLTTGFPPGSTGFPSGSAGFATESAVFQSGSAGFPSAPVGFSSGSAGFSFLDTDFCLRNEGEPTSNMTGQTPAGETERGPDPGQGYEVIPDVVLVQIKEENETYPAGHQDCEILENISSTRGNGNMNMRNIGNTLHKADKTLASEGVTVKSKVKVTRSLHTGPTPRAHVWPESKATREKAAQSGSDFNNPDPLMSHQGSPSAGRPDRTNEWESNQSNVQLSRGPPNVQQNPKIFTCTECDKSYDLKGKLIRHMVTHSGVRPYPCTECGKSFYQMPHLIRHHRTHSGEKPYACSFCHKRFNRKDNLNGHERIHTGEKVSPTKYKP
ncbi:hypothetical protein NDU88_000044 [Pleurodeles waltl]|uniref:C2H2-type domain-containing protein n=1 Tax=Pleurodeles waltl TaxID=8319 RepID=A0AAV7KNI6_PLEWA|nr:hypothetical protein NDU88_000044 [Pleurodeles waltl]